MLDLAVIVPSRGRPENIRKVISAWDFTNAWDVAHLVLAVDADDPTYQGYLDLFEETRHPDTGEALFSIVTLDTWLPMVHKLDRVALNLALSLKYRALGFAGDDHLPQTINWAQRYLAVLGELGTGMVFGDDGFQGANLSTEWAVTADAVRALGRMVPAPVEHMYCDNSMMDLFGGAGALRHLPEVRIEHMHPIAGKAENDDQYKRVNHRDQFKTDGTAYESWKRSGLVNDIRVIRALRPGMPDIRPTSEQKKTRPGLMPRATPRRPRGTAVTRYGIPRHFKRVTRATPDEIGVTLADLAAQVPAGQAIVELGVFQGWTSLMLSWGARQGAGAHVWGFDAWDLPGNTYGPPFIEPGSKAWADYHVMALGYGKDITLTRSFSAEAARDWDGPAVGLLFVDGDHSKEGARQDIELWAPHLEPGATIAVDDYGHPDWPGVAEAVDELVAEGFLKPIQIFHERLAVTALTDNWAGDPTPAPTAITSEGVSPSPEVVYAEGIENGLSDYEARDDAYPAAEGQVAVESAPLADLPEEAYASDAVDLPSEVVDRERVREGELEAVAEGTPIGELTIYELKALAKARSIVLGRRKDKRDDILQALKDGK